MEYFLTTDGSLFALFLSSLLSATILPGNSELALFAVVRLHPNRISDALILATVGNTLGGMSTYLLARLLPRKELPGRLSLVNRYGVLALLFSWTPVVGDALCAAAGWLRLNWLASTFWIALGKFGRYLAVVAAAGWL